MNVAGQPDFMRISNRISINTQFKLEQVLFKILFHGCRNLPSNWVLRLGEKFGALARKLGIRSETTLKNIELALGSDLGNTEIDRIAKEVFCHFGRELFRIMMLEHVARRPLEGWIDIEGYDCVKNRKT